MPKKFTGLALILAIAAIGLVVLGLRQREGMIGLKNSAATAISERAKSKVELNKRLAVATRAKVAVEAAVARAAAAKDAPHVVINVDPKRYPEFFENERKMAQTRTLASYREALAAMNLPPDKLAKLKELIGARSDARFDAQDAAEEAGFARNSREAMTAVAQANGDVENEIRDLLGTDGYRQMQQLQQEQLMKQVISQEVVPEMSGAGMPVTPDQVDALAKMQAGLNPATNPGFQAMMRQPPDPETGLNGRDQALIAGAAQILSPDQLQVYRQDKIDAAREQVLMRQVMQQTGVTETSSIEPVF